MKKMICHRAQFFIISHGSFHNLTWKFQHLTNFLKVLDIKLKHLLSSSSFFILIMIIGHDLKLSKIFVFPSRVKILHDIFWYPPPPQKKDFEL